MGDKVVVARPGGGTALLLGPTAATIWAATLQWASIEQLGAELAATFPQVQPEERADALEQILHMLESEGLVERSG